MVVKTDYRLTQVKSIAECSKGEHSAIISTFIKLPVLSIYEWPFYTGFTVDDLILTLICQSFRPENVVCF